MRHGWILMGFLLIALPGCVTSMDQRTTGADGCALPPRYVLAKYGADVKVAEANLGSVYNAYVKGLDFQYRPEVVSLASQAAVDAEVLTYLRCLAVKRDGFSHDQAMWMEGRLIFMRSNPTPDQIIKWNEKNPPPVGPRQLSDAGDRLYQAKLAGGRGDDSRAMELIDGVLDADPHHIGALKQRAELWIKLDNLERAEQDGEAILAINPKLALGFIVKSHVLALRADSKQNPNQRRMLLNSAIDLGKSATQIEPDNPWAFGVLADALYRRDGPSAAIEATSRAALLAPRDASIRQNCAELHYLAQQYSAALEHFRVAVELQPKFPGSYVRLGQSLLKLRRPSEAVEPLRKATQLDANMVVAWRALGQAQFATGDSGASASFERALALNASDAATLQYFGRLRMQQNEIAKGRELFERAIRARPEDVVPRTSYADGLIGASLKFSRPELADEAYVHLQVAASMSPQNHMIRANICVTLMVAGRADDAFKCLEEGIAEWPDDLGFRLNRGVWLLQRQHYQKAADDFRFVLERKPNHVFAMLGMVRCCFCQRQWDRAAELLQNAVAVPQDQIAAYAQDSFSGIVCGDDGFIAVGPDIHGVAWQLLANIEVVRGNLAAAGAAYDKATTHGFAVQDTYINSACVRFVTEGGTAALDMIKAGLSRHPDDADLLFHKGSYELALSRLDDAEATFRQLVESHPNRADGFRGQGLTKVGRGDFEAAEQCYSKALEVDPTDTDSRQNLVLARQRKGNLNGFDKALAKELRKSLLEQAKRPCP